MQPKITLIKEDITRLKVDAIVTVKKFTENNETLQEIIFVCFDEENYTIYEKLLGDIFHIS
mgnify:CR=1 FL=1